MAKPSNKYSNKLLIHMIKTLIDLAEKGIMPDFLIRSGVRRMQKE